ncbi:hypothetical protein BHE74_00026631 [Ensete ventricosum]|nr:hypothetical protein BHE74_00026631 [Ensete ventricosum]
MHLIDCDSSPIQSHCTLQEEESSCMERETAIGHVHFDAGRDQGSWQQKIATPAMKTVIGLQQKVKVRQPYTLLAVMSFARIQEEQLNHEVRRTRVAPRPTMSRPTAPSTSIQAPAPKKLTRDKLHEQSAKELCWHCDELWSREHHCKKGQLLVIEPAEDEDNETSEEALEPYEEAMEEEFQPANYAVHALAGYSNPKGKQVILRGSPAATTTTPHLEGVPKEESNGFPIQIQEFHEIEDKKPLPQLTKFLGISTQPSRLADPPMLNRSKLLPVVARPDCFIQPQKVKDKRVVQEMTETRIVRPCLFPAITRPYILFPEDKLLLKCYILLNSPWLLMQHFQISGDFHDFPQDRTMMLKDFLDDDLQSMAQDREKIEPL